MSEAIPRRRKADLFEAPCAQPGCPAVSVLYERVDRVEATVNLRFDEVASRMGLLNELRGEVIEDRAIFVLKENFEARMRTLERTVWMALGGAVVLGALAQLFVWLVTHR